MKNKPKQTGMQKIIQIVMDSKTMNEAYENVILSPIQVDPNDSDWFADKYNPNNTRTMKQSFELFYNDIKNEEK